MYRHPRGGAGGRHSRQVLRVWRDQEHPPEPRPADGLPEGVRPCGVRDLQGGAGGQGRAGW